MKFTFDENKINIFTLIPYGEMREKDYVIRKCIESWRKIPNSVIYLFDIQDVKDTFPGMAENDRYYKVFNNEYLKPNEKPTEKVIIYDAQWWLDPIKYVKHLEYYRKEQNLSTDILRLKLLQEIPNSVYMDSDVYINDVEVFLKTFNDPRNTCYKLKYQSNCCFCVKKGKTRSEIIDKLISFYNDENVPIQIDNSVYLAFKATRERMDNDRDKFLFKCFDDPYQFRDIPYVTHLFSIKLSLRSIHDIRFGDDNVISYKNMYKNNNTSLRIHILKNNVHDLKWFDNFMWKSGSSELMQTRYKDFINKISCNRKDSTDKILDLVFVDFIFTVSSKLFVLESGTISNVVNNDDHVHVHVIDSLRQMYNSYEKTDFKEMFIREFIQNLLFNNRQIKIDDFKTYTITKCDNAEDFYIIDDNQN